MTSKPRQSRAKRKTASPSINALALQPPVVVEVPKPAAWVQRLSATQRIALIVGVIYFSLSFFTFRHVIANIPLVLNGEAVINGDELVPFFNPNSQLIDQAAGKFNQLTNGYEFRVRYSILTTWLRYYKVLPFALVLVVPGVTYLSYLFVALLLVRILPQYKPEAVYQLTAAPVLMIFIIMAYAKITHFYTLILGFSLCLVSITLMTYGLIFPQKNPYKPIIAACVITLFNPAVHYLILFALYMAFAVLTLVVMDGIAVFKDGSWRNIYRPRMWWNGWQIFKKDWRRLFREVRFWRCVGAFAMLGLGTLLPYALFVKFYALRGVPNLSETVPGDFYFIQDASISLGHVLAFDMAGIMDKEFTGDYLAKVPRYSNMIYMLLLFIPLFLKRARDEIFHTAELKAFMNVMYVVTFFTMWATLGYSGPSWLPTFHRTMAFISVIANKLQSGVGDLVVKLMGTIVQVLRFPHRFELVTFMVATILISISIIWLHDTFMKKGFGEVVWVLTGKRIGEAKSKLKQKQTAVKKEAGRFVPVMMVLLFMVPIFSNESYRIVFTSGDFHHFLTPYPVGPLKEVKEALLQLPPGKVVVLPPTETAKVIVDINGVEHKFIDKFHIYYLDLPSYYYGLTGDSDNKHEFFLMLRALYYQQPWWINIARDLDLKYIVVNKELVANTVGGQEYLREVERILIPELDSRDGYVKKLMENESYVLYEFTDLPTAERVPLYLDVDWNSFIRILSSNLELTRYYDLRHTMVVGDLESFDSLTLVTDDEHESALDLYLKANKTQFARPSSVILPFDPEQISSSYYLSPMFRLFQFFSDSKYNRLDMITPGLWGTIEGGFIGVPREAPFRIDVTLPEAGEYHLLMRGAISAVDMEMESKLFAEPLRISLASDPSNLAFFDKRLVFSSSRTPLDVSQYTLKELGQLIPTDVVVVNYQYQFFDLGVVTAGKGKYPIYFSKLNDAPMLVEGILVIPEEAYQNLALPANVTVVQPNELCCGSVIMQGEEP
ncbi:MAG: hypothetical protein IPG80_18245 [Anaerolineales bacterium]|uniref:hypothetical protein n=1 Tax=Candidatus Villigracilis vicinus TaxID=3140679 RepID=UPI003134FDD8|nr:hypothetical protein [Anaerolineales bacterium]